MANVFRPGNHVHSSTSTESFPFHPRNVISSPSTSGYQGHLECAVCIFHKTVCNVRKYCFRIFALHDHLNKGTRSMCHIAYCILRSMCHIAYMPHSIFQGSTTLEYCYINQIILVNIASFAYVLLV